MTILSKALWSVIAVSSAAIVGIVWMARRKSEPARSTISAATGTATAHGIASATAVVRRSFMGPHLSAADYFASELVLHENGKGVADYETHYEHALRLASAAIILSFAAIEAAVDEVEDDLALPPALIAGIEKASTLDKCQAILAFANVAAFDPGRQPFQSADLLRKIRNGLVHPKAEWDDNQQAHASLTRQINGAHLSLSPFLPDPSLAFPRGFASGAVAQWAAESARSFIRSFRTNLGLDPNV